MKNAIFVQLNLKNAIFKEKSEENGDKEKDKVDGEKKEETNTKNQESENGENKDKD